MTAAFIGLGSNVGDRLSYLRRAVIDLDNSFGIEFVAASSIYRTDPVGPPQPDFLNAVIEISTELDPFALLGICKRIEHEMGRQTRGRWKQREIDLDLLIVGDVIVSSAELTVPHPMMASRGFVLVPLSDLDPSLELPDGETVLRAVERVGRDGVELFAGPEALWPPPKRPRR